MTREELDAVRNHISNLPTVGAMYAPVLVEWAGVLLRQRDEVTAQRDNAVDASKEGAWMARALDAERERDALKERIARMMESISMACEEPPTNCECAGCSYAREKGGDV